MGYSRDKSNYHIETGTWIATLATGATTTPVGLDVGNYTKIGKMVIVEFSGQWATSITVNGTELTISGLPFTANNHYVGTVGYQARVVYGNYNFTWISSGTTTVRFRTMASSEGVDLPLNTEGAGTYTPHSGFNLTYYTDD